MTKVLLYGVTGFTGQLIAQSLQQHNIPFDVAGRNLAATETAAKRFNRGFQTFSITDSRAVDVLRRYQVLINAAGPFRITAAPLARACIEAGTHYLDLAGEYADFRSVSQIADSSRAQIKAGSRNEVSLISGIGFGVVPTDLVAAYLAKRMPDGKRLSIAFAADGGVSKGTLKVLLSDLHSLGIKITNGQEEPARFGQEKRTVDFGEGGHRKVGTNPWRADLFSSRQSTPATSIQTFTAFPAALSFLAGPLGKALFFNPLARALGKFAEKFLPEGPKPAQLQKGRTFVWARLENDAGAWIETCVSGPEAYLFTGLCAAAITSAVLKQSPAGVVTPSQLLSLDELLQLDRVQLEYERQGAC